MGQRQELADNAADVTSWDGSFLDSQRSSAMGKSLDESAAFANRWDIWTFIDTTQHHRRVYLHR